MAKRKLDDAKITDYYNRKINNALLYLGHEIVVAHSVLANGLGLENIWEFNDDAESIYTTIEKLTEDLTRDSLEEKLKAYAE